MYVPVPHHVRFAKTKKGPGTFVYGGGEIWVEHIPGVQARDKQGAPVFDRATREPVWAKKPQDIKNERDPYVLRGIEFPEGEPIEVPDPSLAFKLRGMACFTEVELDAEPPAPPENKAIADMTKAELLAAGKARGLDVNLRMSRDELLAEVATAP